MNRPCSHWVEALGDPCFTVRCTAARALEQIDPTAAAKAIARAARGE